MDISQRFFLGVDVGGTKTHALICDETGNAAGFGKSGPGNWESVGLDGLYKTLEQAINQALR
ncbi:MAG: BadF/BadG/BcrA/BcrD ATPase family protein, partial [Chloroflexota bacterium]